MQALPCFEASLTNRTVINGRYLASIVLPILCSNTTMNDPIITNAIAYPSYISYALRAFTLTPLSGNVGTFIFLIRLVDKSNSSLTLNKYFQIRINEN